MNKRAHTDQRAAGRLGSLLTLVAVLLLTAGCGSERGDAADRRPNILFILADDLGYHQLGVMGQDKIATPNIDRLAAQGVLFTDAYAGGTVCSPSRVALLTGRDGRLLHGNTNLISLRATDVTWAHVLQRSGYRTMLVGKYGVGSRIGVNDPLSMGFDAWYGLLDNLSAHRQYPETVWIDNETQAVAGNADGGKAAYAQDLFAARAVDFIRSDHDRPFALFLSFTAPHAELAAPAEFVRQYIGRFAERRYSGMSTGAPADRYAPFYPDPVDEPNAVVAAMISALDSNVGRVLAALEDTGLDGNTIVFVTSDNGPHAEGGADPTFFDAPAPLRGLKRDLHEGGIRVPMIVRWPGVAEAGRVDATPWAFWDILPTVADIADAPDRALAGVATNGVTIAPLLADASATLPDRMLYWEHGTLDIARLDIAPADIPSAIRRGDLENVDLPVGRLRQAARHGRWKAVRDGMEGVIQLYDLSSDPGERTDLSQQERDVTDRFTRLFETRVRK